MIVNTDVIQTVSKALKDFTRAKYNTDCYVVGERIYAPSSFPCAWVVELDNHSEKRAEALDFTDDQRRSVFECQTFSNLRSGATMQAKYLMDEITRVMKDLGYRCTMCNPVDNGADVTIKRYVARYTRFIGGGDTI